VAQGFAKATSGQGENLTLLEKASSGHEDVATLLEAA
jgi:hypothetical protein